MPTVFDVAKLTKQISALDKLQANPGFWRDRTRAAAVSMQLADLKNEVNFITETNRTIVDLSELLSLARSENDAATLKTIEQDMLALEKIIALKENELRFNGPHDRSNAIMTIQAGAGGSDAQDWAAMLERMYLRFAESQHWPTKIIHRSPGEEAGIKGSVISITGKFAFGILRGEHGIHRLVRQSPFNADALRQTSFARVEILPQIPPAEQPIIAAKDLEISTFRASTAGGQHVNKTSSAVRIRHLPTSIVVECQNERSQAQNKAQALSVLAAKLQTLMDQQHAKKISDLKGEVKEAAWGNQIRSYVLHPYKLVKDHRSGVQSTDPNEVLDGNLWPFLNVVQ